MALDRITTSRLVLRGWEESDAEAVLEIYSHGEVWPWLGAAPAPCHDLDAARARVTRWSALGQGAYGLWAVETPGIDGISPQPCGSVLVVPLPRSDGEGSSATEIGWHLHPHAWSHGIATEGARALIERARGAGITELHAVVHPDNHRSKAVCVRLGMSSLGRTRQWYGVELDDYLLQL